MQNTHSCHLGSSWGLERNKTFQTGSHTPEETQIYMSVHMWCRTGLSKGGNITQGNGCQWPVTSNCSTATREGAILYERRGSCLLWINDIKMMRLMCEKGPTRMKDTGALPHPQRQQALPWQWKWELTELFWKVAARLSASTPNTEWEGRTVASAVCSSVMPPLLPSHFPKWLPPFKLMSQQFMTEVLPAY